jgi:mono/diheme cytochrome c family protein
MRTLSLVLLGVLLTLVAFAAGGAIYASRSGLTAKATPPHIEAAVARAARHLAIPAADRAMRSPVTPTRDILTDAMAHFADHCAVCHAADGSGETETGRGLYPPAPDMRMQETQSLSDGELFYIIEHGVRFTGMPGWSTGTDSGRDASWKLVAVIRHLPAMTTSEIDAVKAQMPRSPEEIRAEIEEERFLNQGDSK